MSKADGPAVGSATLRTIVGRMASWLGVGLCALYALFALAVAITEILSLLGAAPAVKPRAVPPLFILHVLSGAVALVTGSVQLRLGRPTTPRRAQIHRLLGPIYVWAARVTCVAGVVVSVYFGVGLVGTLVFAAWASSWFSATTIALRHIRSGRVAPHRRWMIRSFALALVFVTFDFARQALAGTGLARVVDPHPAVPEQGAWAEDPAARRRASNYSWADSCVGVVAV